MKNLLPGQFLAAFAATIFGGALQATSQDVRITEEIIQVEYDFNGKTYVISRDQNPNAKIPDAYALTSRPCPGFCIQPIIIHEGVDTFGELETLSFLKEKVNQGQGFLIDSRSSDWYAKGTIPGAVNLPFNAFVPGPENVFFDSLMVMLSGKQTAEGNWEFSDPKDLLLFCNGPWCDQSPTAIRNLLAINYPAEKLHYYRGGMQSWVSNGLTIEVPG